MKIQKVTESYYAPYQIASGPSSKIKVKIGFSSVKK